MSNLTQGNWKARSIYMESGTNWSVVDNHNRCIASINTVAMSDEDELRVNANLLSAAPDLLKFAEFFLAEIDAHNITNSKRAACNQYNAIS